MKGYDILESVMFHEENPKHLASLAIKENLYVRGWNMRNELERILSNGLGNNEIILLATLADYPIGVCIVYDKHIEIFVRKAYRRYGIGSKMVEIMKSKRNDILWGSEGTQGTLDFWRKNKIGTH